MARAHVVPRLEVADVEKSVVFYESLGFRKRSLLRDTAGNPVRATVEIQGAAFALVLRRTPPAAPGLGVALGVHVRDLSLLRSHALEAGAVEGEDEEGVRVRDPDGYLLVFRKERRRAPPRPRRAVRKKRKRRR